MYTWISVKNVLQSVKGGGWYVSKLGEAAPSIVSATELLVLFSLAKINDSFVLGLVLVVISLRSHN